MREFTSLSKEGGLQTWIAIGGFDFSDPDQPTHKTWSELCASKTARAAFIESVRDYMDEYGFQGVDLDWEYPGDAKRGGNKLADTRNLATLVREMRAAYGAEYGISLTLAPNYWYLRWFDPKAMEPYVDFFGFMAYDLHGSWDADVLTLGSLVRGQADIREIANNTVPLWFDGLDPQKINFGLAMYGRGYTLADPSCNQLLCPFKGPSKPAPCTGSNGVMSLREIKQLIKLRGLEPQYLPDSMMKQVTWDDQWIGYDDEETFAAKKAWADSKCFGGTMVWSIDFEGAGSGDAADDAYGEEEAEDVNYVAAFIGTDVYQQSTAQCPAPCIMVFPPSTLDEPTVVTITHAPYTATLQVGSTTTTVVAQPSPATVTSTVTVINYSNLHIRTETEPGARLTVRPSFSAPEVPVVVTGQDGETTTRTVVPPPPGDFAYGSSSSAYEDDGDDEVDLVPATEWPFMPPSTATPVTTLTDDDDDYYYIPLPTGTPTRLATLSTGSSTPSTTWPSSGTIEPVTDKTKPTPPGSDRVSCTAWFFFICISWNDLEVDSWDFVLPPGEIGPGPPPISLLNLPTGWKIGGYAENNNCLPPWPKMTVNGQGVIPTLPPKPAACEPTTATLTIESTSYGTTSTDGTVRTTASSTLSHEFPIVGCAVEDWSTATTKTACDARATWSPLKNRDPDIVSDNDGLERVTARQNSDSDSDCDESEILDALVWPASHTGGDKSGFLAKLDAAVAAGMLESYNVIEAKSAGFTAFIYLNKLVTDHWNSEIEGHEYIGVSTNLGAGAASLFFKLLRD